eukprot:SAG31_NODE_2101_length_6445_cov_16.552159_1_plen_152_part_00
MVFLPSTYGFPSLYASPSEAKSLLNLVRFTKLVGTSIVQIFGISILKETIEILHVLNLVLCVPSRDARVGDVNLHPIASSAAMRILCWARISRRYRTKFSSTVVATAVRGYGRPKFTVVPVLGTDLNFGPGCDAMHDRMRWCRSYLNLHVN